MNGRHRLVRRRRRGLSLIAGSGLASGTLVALAVPAPPAVAADPCTVPQLTDFVVSQGPAEYTALAPGKTSLVKLFLSTPSCLPAGVAVRVSGASLTVAGTSEPVTVAAQLPLPPLAPSATSPVPSTPSDVLFLVPGSAMKPLAGRDTVTFSATVQYAVTANGQTLSDSVTLASAPGGGSPLVGRFVPGVSDVDVLVVPLGVSGGTAATGPTLASQYTPATRNATEEGFGTARRLLPTSDDGLRSTEAAGIVLPQQAPFCPNGVTFSTQLAPRLEAQRVAWNSVATNTHMDRVLGVIDPAISGGASTEDDVSSSCADGFGQLAAPSDGVVTGELKSSGPGRAAYARAVTTTSTFGGPAVGSLFGMELAHTTGATSPTYVPNKTALNGGQRSDGAHSRNVSGDPRGTRRAYDLDTQELIASPRSLMNYSLRGWHDDATVLEKEDWDYVLCSLLPVPAGVPVNVALASALPPQLTGCDHPGGFGYAAAATTGTYAVMGTTDGTSDGTTAHTVDSASKVADQPVPDSELRVVQRNAQGQVIGNDGIAVHSTNTEHVHGNEVQADQFASFGSSVPARLGTRTLELYLGNPSPTNPPLYSRQVTTPPTFQKVELGPASGTITVGHPTPDNVRLDIFGRCPGGPAKPLVVGAAPLVTTPAVLGLPGTATFVSTYDASLTCPDAVLEYRVTDGIQSTTGSGGAVDGLSTASAEITAPNEGDTITSGASIGLAGRVRDAAGQQVETVEWEVRHVDAGGVVTTQTVASTVTSTAVPPAGGWKTGLTTITLRGIDAQGGVVAATSRSFVIVQDGDGDGLSDDQERAFTCLAQGVTDPFTANLDVDGDGFANIDEVLTGGDPCVSANNVTVRFDPISLYKSANGQGVTFYLSAPRGFSLGALSSSDLYVQQVGGATVARLTGERHTLPATAFTLTSATTATVKVDRQKLVALLGDRLGYTPIFLGTLDGRTVRGTDPVAPRLFP